MMSKISTDILRGAFIPFAWAMWCPLVPLRSIVSCTSSAAAPSQQCGWLRLSANLRESTPIIYFCTISSGHSRRYVALKICAADADPTHELNIFSRVSSHESTPNVLQLRDSFYLQGPNGVHTVLVHDVLGSLLTVVRSPSGYKHARTLCHQIACGLAALHRRGIVHGGKCSHNIPAGYETAD